MVSSAEVAEEVTMDALALVVPEEAEADISALVVRV